MYHHFIRGYFDGDGSVGIYNNSLKHPYNVLRSSFTSGSINFIHSIQKLINKTGYVRQEKDRSCYSLYYAPKDSRTLAEYMYKDATVYLQRKYDIFQQVLQRRSETIIANPL